MMEAARMQRMAEMIRLGLRQAMKSTLLSDLNSSMGVELLDQTDRVLTRRPPKTRPTSTWVTMTEVNIEVTMPIAKVIAKPLIGPEPKAIRPNAAIRWVTLASRIVAQALS